MADDLRGRGAAARFDVALRTLDPSRWELFERLCRMNLAAEFIDFRTVAGTDDGGRDGELFGTSSDPHVAFQFSVRKDWESKIRQTVKRLKKTFPSISTLIYATNQEIGPRSDGLRLELRRGGFYLDVRDKSWFVDRIYLDSNRTLAAQDRVPGRGV